MYQYFGELPTDLNMQEDTIGPPPAYFRPSGVFFYGLDGFGDHRPNPLKILRNLKTKQEWPGTIPPVAGLYTKIDPLSPMFREDRPTYGYGDISMSSSLIGVGIVAMVALVIYLVKFKH